MSGSPAVDAEAEKRKGEPTVACGGGFASRQLAHCRWDEGYASGVPSGTAGAGGRDWAAGCSVGQLLLPSRRGWR